MLEGGYTTLQSPTDPRSVLSLFPEFRPDLILLDLMMPHLDGFAVTAHRRRPPGRPGPLGHLKPETFLGCAPLQFRHIDRCMSQVGVMSLVGAAHGAVPRRR